MKKKLCLAVAALVASASLISLPACKSSYDLVYAAWNLSTEAVNNVERKMIKEFEKQHNVKVKIEENISLSAYDDSITALAVKNNLPDVFMISNMNYGLKSRYVSNIKDLVDKDTTDWNEIPKPIEEAVHYKSGIYAVPFAMHMMGYFVNVNLLENYNLDNYVEEELTFESFMEIVRTMSAHKVDGQMGLSHENTIFEWYPSSVNENYGWFTWDGSEYHLDSQEFKDGLAKTREIRTGGYSYDSLSEEDRNAYFEGVDGYVALWNAGNLAIRWGYSYEVPDMKKNTDFTIKFMGVPGGRTPIVGDYLAISNTCKNRDLAYKFAKWMSFDRAGINKRIELETDVTNTMPLTTNQTVIDAYFNKFTAVDGLKEAFDTLDNGIIESVKVVPGYTLSRWKALTGISETIGGETISNVEIGQYLDGCWNGELQYADKATQINALANNQYKKAIAQFEAFYN